MGAEEVELIVAVVWERLVDDEGLVNIEDNPAEDMFEEDWEDAGCGSFLISRKERIFRANLK